LHHPLIFLTYFPHFFSSLFFLAFFPPLTGHEGIDAQGECSKHGLRLCYRSELCPNGRHYDPFGGVKTVYSSPDDDDGRNRRKDTKLVSGLFPRCFSLFLVVSRCLSLFLVVCLCFSLLVFVCLCLSLFLVVCLCLSLFVFVCRCSSLFLVVPLCFSLFLVVCLCSSLFFVFASFCFLLLPFASFCFLLLPFATCQVQSHTH
jgi:hypothetical protein